MSQPNIGVLFNADRLDRQEFISYAQRLDEMGCHSLWLPELFSRDPFACAGYLLAATNSILLATGIANIYARDPAASVSAAASLQELSEGRFALGLGVSNVSLNQARGHQWQPPVAKLEAYLRAMAAVKLSAPQPEFPVHVAAHGPKMLHAAATLADGVNSYLMPAAHARQARAIIGADSQLNTMLFCLQESDPEQARRTARKAVAYYMGLDYYHRAWRSFGFTDADFADGGSDALIDSIVAWGTAADIQTRIQELHTLGATTVVVIPIGGRKGQPDWKLLGEIVGT